MRPSELVDDDFLMRSSSTILDARTEPRFRGGLRVSSFLYLFVVSICRLLGTASAALSYAAIVYP